MGKLALIRLTNVCILSVVRWAGKFRTEKFSLIIFGEPEFPMNIEE